MVLNALFTKRYHRIGSGCRCKERLSAGVDGFVRTLRREHHGDQKLKRGVVVQLGFWFRNGSAQGRKTAMNILWIHGAHYPRRQMAVLGDMLHVVPEVRSVT